MGRRGRAADRGVPGRHLGRDGPRRQLTRPGADAGSAVVDFVLVSVLLTFVFVGLVQLALVLHVRNVLVDAAGEGARHGALVGSSPAAGAQRTRDLVTATLDARYADAVSARVEAVPGGQVVVVDVRAPLPVVGLLGPRTLDVSGHALVEGG